MVPALLILFGVALVSGFHQGFKKSEGAVIEQSRAFFEEGQLEEAIKLLERRLAEKPEDVGAAREFGVNLMLLHRYQQAVEYQEFVVRLDPYDAQTRVDLGLNYSRHQGRVQEAVEALSEAVAISPSPRNRVLLAQCLALSGRLQEAEDLARSVAQESPDYPFAQKFLRELASERGLGWSSQGGA